VGRVRRVGVEFKGACLPGRFRIAGFIFKDKLLLADCARRRGTMLNIVDG
jgi:hypothetical protein